jgi:deoxyribodipyrimidine photo-lyase
MSDALQQLATDPRLTRRTPGDPDPSGRCVVYWMQRAQRAVDNPALDAAIGVGNALRQPVVVFLAPVPFYPHGNHRHYQFLFQGFAELEPALTRRGVGLVFRFAPDHRVEAFADEVDASVVIGDENPLREPAAWRTRVAQRLRVPLWTVDADVIVPTNLLEKEQYAARTMRPRIHALLPQFLVRPPAPKAHAPWRMPRQVRRVRPSARIPAGFPLVRAVAPVETYRGGMAAARTSLRRFVRTRLAGYHVDRNHPERDGTSQLSPYLHFGHIGPRTVALAVRDADAPEADRAALLEELIVRRELAINFVRFNSRYDRLAGCESWARRTLDEHRADVRAPRYAEALLESADTHDPLWNAAQRQVVETGWMPGYMRMYWAKKILEWTDSPDAALEIAIRLNDRYQLDGRDPNGYTGIAWAIGGKHDRAWGPERAVYGKVRYMSFASTRRKFDSRAYIARWSPGPETR